VIIRQFHQNDTDAILQLANNFAFFDGPLLEEDLTITHAFQEGFIVADENERIIGFAYGYFKDVPKGVLDNWKVSKVATIELLVVDSIHENQGIGTMLLENLIEIFRQAGADLIGLTCPVQAKTAKHLYEKMGFEVSAYHMRKRLV
jgi:ribosomal protein S18 acetylase RimI-like enzyme